MQKFIGKMALGLCLCGPASTLAQTTPPPVPPSQVFEQVDQPAEYPAGVDGWRRYLEGNLRYPKKALRKKTQGVAKVQFLVDTLGQVSDVTILSDPGDGLGEEAMRIIRESGRWKPALLQGRKVKFRHIQAITFLLE